MCRSRRELSNEYLVAKIDVNTAEDEPLEVWGKIIQYYSFVSLLAIGYLLLLSNGSCFLSHFRSSEDAHDQKYREGTTETIGKLLTCGKQTNKRTNAWTRPLWQSRGRSTPSAYEYRESQRIISRQESKHQRQASWGSTHLKTSTP